MTIEANGTRSVNSDSLPHALGILATGTVLNFLGSVYSLGGRLAFSLILARLLDPGSLGIYFLSLTVANIFAIISVGGFEQALLRYLAAHRTEGNWPALLGTLRFSLRAVGGISLLTAVVLAAGAPWIAVNGFGKPEITAALQIIAISIPLCSLEMVILAATQAFKEMKYKVWIESVLHPTLKIGLTVFFLALGWRLYGAISAYLITLAICVGLSQKGLRRLVRTGLPQGELTCDRKELWAYTTPLLGVTVATILLQYASTLILAYFRSVEEVGVYSICLTAVSLSGFALPVVSQIFAPFIAELHRQGDIGRLRQLFKVVTLWALELFLPLALILSVGAATFLSLFGNHFRAAAPVLVVLILGQLFNIVTGPVGLVLSMTGQTRLQFYNSLFTLILQCGVAIVLIPSWGLMGAAIANATAMVCVNLARVVEAYWLLRAHPFSFSLAKPVGAAAAALVVTLPLWAQGYNMGYAKVGLLSLAVFLVYGGILFGLGLDPTSRLAWEQLRARLVRPSSKTLTSSVGRNKL